MLQKINKLVLDLQNTNSQKDKLEILKLYSNDQQVTKFFKYCYDQDILFGLTSANLIKNPKLSEFELFENVFQLCDLLISKKYTGNRAIALTNGFINANNRYENLLYNFFDKNLKIGMNVTQINKALGNIISVFKVALADTYQPKKQEKYQLNKYCIQRKLNGLRMIVFINYKGTDTPEIIFKSRTGKEFNTMTKIENELVNVYNNSLYKGTDIVLDGEICIIDNEGKQDWNRAVSQARRKNHTIYNPMYIIFDILTKDEFFGFKQSMNYNVRLDNIKRFFGNNRLEHMKLVFSVPYSKEHLNKLTEEFLNNEKWEGFIFRKNCPYQSGRSSDLLKYKLFKDAEYTVIGVKDSIDQMLNDKGVMVDTPCVGSLIIKHKDNEVAVGSGLTDEQKIEWYKNPELIIGKQILVKYKEETKNKDGSISLQFPVLKYVFEEERDF